MNNLILIIVTILLLASSSLCVNLPEHWEKLTCKAETGNYIGTAFLLRYKNEIFIVTNKHVVTPGKTSYQIIPNIDVVKEAFKSKDSTKIYEDKNMEDTKLIPPENLYILDKKYDIAMIHITPFIEILNNTLIPESMIGDDSMIKAGREIFFLGYPNGMAGYDPKVPLVRTGIIAGDFKHKIILDGNIFGGSSGSPVFLNVDFENQIESQYLIGIIYEKRHMPAFSKDSLEVDENMGIGIAIKISYIVNTIENWLKENKE